MRGRFWRKDVKLKEEIMAFPDAIDSFRATENRPGIKYDPAKKTTLFSEDLQALGNSIISVQNAIGTFNLTDQGAISDRLDMCVTEDTFDTFNLPWDATIKQIQADLTIPALASKALYSKGLVKLIAFYKAPEISLPVNLYMKLPSYKLIGGVDKDVYFFDALQFQYKYENDFQKYFGRGVAQFSASQPSFIFLNYQSSVTGRYPSAPVVVSERQVTFDIKRFFIKDSIIKFQMEYLARG